VSRRKKGLAPFDLFAYNVQVIQCYQGRFEPPPEPWVPLRSGRGFFCFSLLQPELRHGAAGGLVSDVSHTDRQAGFADPRRIRRLRCQTVNTACHASANQETRARGARPMALIGRRSFSSHWSRAERRLPQARTALPPQGPRRKRGQAPFAGTARRVLRTNGACPLSLRVPRGNRTHRREGSGCITCIQSTDRRGIVLTFPFPLR
jgi:hypothetical protein